MKKLLFWVFIAVIATIDAGAVSFSLSRVGQVSYYSISGYVLDGQGAGISSAVVTLSGAESRTVTTGSNGFFQFSSLIGGSYVLTPSKTGVTFTPSSRSISSLNSDLTGQNFVGQQQLGSTIYYVAATGNDATGTGSISSPWATIQRAVNAANAGDTVLVNNGTYVGFHSVNSGTAASPIVFRANGTSVIINSRNAETTDNVNIENTDYVTVEGFRSINSLRCGIRVATSRGVIVRNNICANPTMWGIFTGFAPEVNIDSNTCYGAVQQHGIYVSNSNVANDNPIIRGNNCYSNYQNGIQLNGDLTSGGDGNIEGALIENNIVHDNGWKGLSLISITRGMVRNNLIYNDGTRGAGAGGIHLAQEPGTGVTCENNVVVNNTIVEPVIGCIRITDGSTNTMFNNLCVGSSGIADEAGGNSVDGASNIFRASSTGLFVSPTIGNYQLASNSAAIEAGIANYATKSAPSTDIMGNARPSGSRFDAGAYEYSVTAPATYYVRGYVRDSSAAGISGVLVTVSGAVALSTTTASDGFYQFVDLSQNNSYTITPSKSGYTFSPVSISTGSLTANWDNRNFTGTIIAAPTYVISGYVRNGSGTAVNGATVALSGGATRTATTASGGYYEFTSLTSGIAYTITPSVANGSFAPVSISTNSLGGNLTNRNFTVSYTYSISGTVRNSGGSALANTTVNLTGGATRTATSASDGTYSFTGLAGSAAYSITSQLSGYSFAPVSISTNSLNGNLIGRDFTGTVISAPTYTISGYVRNGSGTGINGATVALSGGAAGTTTTVSGGYYEFTGLTSGMGYTVTPSVANGTFVPVSISTNSLGGNLTNRNFTVSYAYSISGTVRNSGGSALANTTVNLTGGATRTATSASNGTYSFASLAGSSAYTITPQLSGYTFAPVSISTNSLNANLTGRDFTGTIIAAPTYTISGYVRNGSGTGINGATVALSGGATRTATTASGGYYEFTSLTSGTAYTVTPSVANGNFAPVTISTNSLGGNLTNRNFTVSYAYSISGTIRNSGGSALANTTVNLTGGATRTATSASNGNYSFTGLAGSSAYTITSQLSGYTFAPVSISTNSLNGNLTGRDFTGTLLPTGPVTYYIAGTIRDMFGFAINGVNVTLSGSSSAVFTTTSDGFYQFTELPAAGVYTISPSKSSWKFNPSSISVSSLTGNLTGKNFSGRRGFYIKGRVLSSAGEAISGASVVLSGPMSLTTTTDTSGVYEFDDLPEQSAYTITSSKQGFMFIPQSRAVSLLDAPLEGINFVADYSQTLPAGEMKIIGSPQSKGAVNPDNGESAKIYFRGSDFGHFDLKVFSNSGDIVWEDNKENVKEGTFEWFPRDMAGGIYTAHIKGPGINSNKKIAVVR